MGQHLFLNMTPINFTTETGRKVWCDRDMSKCCASPTQLAGNTRIWTNYAKTSSRALCQMSVKHPPHDSELWALCVVLSYHLHMQHGVCQWSHWESAGTCLFNAFPSLCTLQGLLSVSIYVEKSMGGLGWRMLNWYNSQGICAVWTEIEWKENVYSIRATSHTSQEPWPWNSESPKESIETPSQHTPPKSCSVITDPQV
jgi:hypothetical protein